MTPEEGARLPVEYALLGEGAISGRFVEPGGETPWCGRSGHHSEQRSPGGRRAERRLAVQS
jgi:hypothetical protein